MSIYDTPAASDAPEGDPTGAREGATEADTRTVIGLFEDNIDARRALQRLCKGRREVERLSLLFRDREADESGPEERPGAVAHALETTDLNGAARALVGLASIIVPQRGAFLIAGPLGAALAGMSVGLPPATAQETDADDTDAQDDPVALAAMFSEFGFAPDEANYLDHRLTAGTMVVGLTSADGTHLRTARQAFAEENAVYIGMARANGRVARHAAPLLVTPPERSSNGDVVVTDAVAPFYGLCATPVGDHPARSLCGADVVDRNGDNTGSVADLIVEDDAAGEPVVRYVVVAFGGLLGIGRRHAAVPAGLVDLAAKPARVAVDREVLRRAPVHDLETPLSRGEEFAICAYFGVTPYWASGEAGSSEDAGQCAD